MARQFIGRKYENNKWYDMYYNDSSNKVVLIDEDNTWLEIEYVPQQDELTAILIKKESENEYRIKESRKARLKKGIIKYASILLLGTSIGFTIGNLMVPTPSYNIACIGASQSEIDSLTLEYIEKAIDSNSTINKDFKAYILGFFQYICHSDCSSKINRETIDRILNNIDVKNFDNVDVHDQYGAAYGLCDVIRDSDDISTVMVALEYSQHYYSLDPTFKTRLFDALNSKTDDSLLINIVNDGDNYYKEYLMEKYDVGEQKTNEIMDLLKEKYSDDYYQFVTNFILLNNYNLDSEFSSMLGHYVSIWDLLDGNVKYSNNLFDEVVKLNVTSGDSVYDYYYNTDIRKDITNLEYFIKFDRNISQNSGNIDLTNKNDRMLVYLYTIASLDHDNDQELEQNIKSMGYSNYLYNIGQKHIKDVFNDYLSEHNYSVEDIATYVNDLARNAKLSEQDTKLLNEYFICLYEETKLGNVSYATYMTTLQKICLLVYDNTDEETMLEWLDNVLYNVEPEDIMEILTRYKDNQRLTKSGN